MVHGIMTDAQSHGDEREKKFFGKDPLQGPPSDHPAKNFQAPIVSCHKGSKGFRDTTPNQDNFSVTYFKNGWNLACAFDGHGPFGHIVSTRTVQTVPYFLSLTDGWAAASALDADMGPRLEEAFNNSQKELVAHALENTWDVQASGSTAVACLWKDNVVWTANAGDSRCVIGSEISRQVLFETEDHKPNTESEKLRIEASG